MTGVMTGPWLIVKWIGIAVLMLYLVLMLVAIWRFRVKLSRMRIGFYMPMILGNFVSLSVPSIFENVIVTRSCFVVAHVIYIVGIVILVGGLVRKDQESLLKAGELGEHVHSLKLS